MRRSRVAEVCHGSANSHTAILARTMNIPALVGVDFDDSWDAKEVLEECRAELREEGVAVGEVETGVMIEPPPL